MDEAQATEPILALVNEFVARKQRGETPSISEYCDRYPHLASEIRECFPAVALVEDLKPATDDSLFGPISQPMANEQISDYRLVREIGRGGMGVVYEAEQLSLERRVALKILPRGDRVGKNTHERFQREARAAAKMHHTNIVPVFEVGEQGDYFYYAMQLIEGESLDLVIDQLQQTEIESRGKTTQPEVTDAPVSVPYQKLHDALHGRTNRQEFYCAAANLALQVADALAYAHERSIIHRDVKPANVLLDSEGVVWVTDFGLAKTEEEGMTRTGDILGTLRYMAPERFRGQCDARADIYALGLTLYELLALRPAFISHDRLQLIDIVVKTDPPPLSQCNAHVPRDLETIVLKCIDKDPKARYASSAEVADDLRHFLDDEPIKARRLSPWERVYRWSRRNKGLAAALSAISLLLLAVAVGSTLTAAKFRAQNERISRTARLAANRLEEISRLSDSQRLEDLLAEAEQLWPATPENIEVFAAWVDDAEGLRSRLPRHERDLAALRRRASAHLSVGEDDAREMWQFDDPALDWQHKTLAKLVDGIRILESDDVKVSVLASVRKRLQFARTVRQRTIADYRLEWQHACDSIADRRECPQYDGLVITPQLGLVPLGRDPDSGLWEFAHLETGVMPVRREGKLVVDGDTGLVFVLIPGGTFLMGAAPLELGVRIEAQAPAAGQGRPTIAAIESGSFAEQMQLRVGDRPVRVNGRQIETASEFTEMVAVLNSGDVLRVDVLRDGQPVQLTETVPDNVYSEATSVEQPITEVTLAPFFCSKYEMTQGQWDRVSGDNPSSIQEAWLVRPELFFGEQADSNAAASVDLARHPVESISWNETVEVLESRLHLRLPTEAQWEYAARAGTSTVYWFGNDIEDFDNVGNVSDRYAYDHASVALGSFDMQIDDGYASHSPVGIYRPNAFGIHDTVGNVAELCRDAFLDYTTPMLPKTGEKKMRDPLFMAVRGSSFLSLAFANRSAGRVGTYRHDPDAKVGVRPVRALDE